MAFEELDRMKIFSPAASLCVVVILAFAHGLRGQVVAPSPTIGPSAPAEGAPQVPGAEVPEAPALATRITAVQLYSDQALVLRQGSADLPAGRGRLEVSGLPAALRDEAVRARVLSGGA